MKKILIAISLAVYLFLTWHYTTSSAKEAPTEVVVEKVVYQDTTLTPSQIIWLARLMDCESGINASSINPIDLDGTPSNGILQFKTGTFTHYATKYGIEGALMSPEAQVAIVRHWILNPGEVKWQNQFPACVAKLGTPPVK